MFSKSTLGALLSGVVLMLPATAQVSSEGMGDISAWGARYLDSTEKEFPPRLWSGSDEASLLLLMRNTRAGQLTPAERKLLRRAVLSPAERPRGDQAADLLAQRVRLMLELGEARAAAALAPTLDSTVPGLNTETLAVDLEMASGQEATACARLSTSSESGPYWLKLRVVCEILRENFTGAELAAEFATSEGVTDPWFLEAVFAAAGDVPNPPYARFDSGLNIALSAKANLDTSRLTLSGSRPDLAAAAARRAGVTPDLKVRFSEIAGEMDLISIADRRNILLDRLSSEGQAARSAIDQALLAMNDSSLTDTQKAETLARALSNASRSGMQRYGATAKLLLPDLKALNRTAETAANALPFARAALAAGDGQLARKWLSSLDFEGAPAADPFDLAVIEALDLVSGGDASPASQTAVQTRLITAARTGPQKDTAAQLLTYWNGFGHRLGPEARALISASSSKGKRLSPETLTALEAAARSGAIGETALITLKLTDGKPEAIAPADLARLVSVLRSIGAEDIASAFVLEASQYWKE